MPKTTIALMLAGGCLCWAFLGCDDMTLGRKPEPEKVYPAHVAGTVGEYAGIIGGGDLTVQGYGSVVGLGTNGSSEVPPHLRKYFDQYLKKRRLGSERWGTGPLTPRRFLDDVDTGVVLVGGTIPAGAPKGSPFDVFVTALPQTQTRSLEGGVLMPVEMHLSVGGMAVPGGPSKVLAEAAGSVFVNPFVDVSRPGQIAKLREGRIIGGGRVTWPQPIRVQLYSPNYALSKRIERQINMRFPGRDKVANARNRYTVALEIPPEYRDDYRHFLLLVRHLPIQGGPGGFEAKAREVVAAMELPTANHERLALVWEAMGRQVLPFVQSLYTSRNEATAYYSARTGMRLGDEDVAGEVVARFAGMSGSPLQLPAIRELGRHPKFIRGVVTLRGLLEDDNDFVRVGAYEALLERGDRSTVSRTRVADEFSLDLVNSHGRYVIYATVSDSPRIVLFGRNVEVSRPVFFSPPDDTVTVNAREGEEELKVYRKVPRSGGYSETFEIDFNVRTLIRTLGEPSAPGEDGKIMGLGLTYGQIVSVLQRMCKEGDIPAKFVLQPEAQVRRIYRGVPTVGRSDSPED